MPFKVTRLQVPSTTALAAGVEPNDVGVPDQQFSVEQQLLGAWSSVPYSELSVLLVHLRKLSFVNQTNHWVAKGDPFYGDHLLFQRLYEETLELIDSVAERAVGMGSEKNVDLGLQLRQLVDLGSTMNTGFASTIPNQGSLANDSMSTITKTLEALDAFVASLEMKGQLSVGLDNLLCGVADVLEQHMYLLKQRMGR